MIDGILSFAIRQRWLVMIGVLAMACFGAWNFTRLPIDAVPDITNVQIQINSQAPGYSPLEVEQRITFPIETTLAGLPNLENTRSLSRYGLSQVTVIFKDGTDIYFARQLVNERIQQAKDQLPAGIEAAMGPVSTGLGEIYMFTVEAKLDARKSDGEPYTATDLRTIQDWIIRPRQFNPDLLGAHLDAGISCHTGQSGKISTRQSRYASRIRQRAGGACRGQWLLARSQEALA